MDEVIGGMNPGSRVAIADMPMMDPYYPEETGLND
jgi:hypothetical protein